MRSSRSRAGSAVVALAACLVAAGCGSSEGGAAASASAAARGSGAPTASAAPKAEKLPGFDLEGTKDGKPIELASAIAYQRSDDAAIEVLVSTHARDCDTAKKNGIALQKGETLFSLIVIEAIAPDGKAVRKVTESYYGGNTKLGSGGDDPKVERGEGTAPMKITLASLKLEAAGQERAPLELAGTIVAKSCGVIPEPPSSGFTPPPPRPQPDLTFEVAGQKIAMKGALYREDTKDLVLATMPMSCEYSPYSQADVAFLIDAEAKTAHLQGRRIGTMGSSPPEPKPKLTVGKPADGVVEVVIEGSFKVLDWPVKLSGKASALVCAKK